MVYCYYTTYRKDAFIRRLCIYFFYDTEGIVDDYVADAVHAMKEHCEKLLVVCNGKLTSQGRTRFYESGADIVYRRQNKGFDVWAYKYALDKTGWEALRNYDEVIMMNFTIIGPIHPLSEMFMAMDRKGALDFWGLSVHHGENYDPWGIMPNGYIPEHLQSHFICIRKSLLSSVHFRNYWANMRPINTYQEAIGYHEAIFTPTFEKLGYTWDSYVHSEDLKPLTSYPLMFRPLDIIRDRRCPFFKRKAFLLSATEYAAAGAVSAPKDTLDYLLSIQYDTRKIFQNLVRYSNQVDLRITSNQNYVVETDSNWENFIPHITNTCAFVVYVDDLISMKALTEHLLDGHDHPDTFILVSSKLGREHLDKELRNNPFVKSIFEGALQDWLIVASKISSHYDRLAFVNVRENSPSMYPNTKYGLVKHSLNSLEACQDPFSNTSAVLGKNGHIGALATPVPVWWDQGSWSRWNYRVFNKASTLLKRQGVYVAIDRSKPPYAPVGWGLLIRSSILEGLLQKTDIDVLRKNSTEVIFTSIPFSLQSNGYLLGIVYTPQLITEERSHYQLTDALYRNPETTTPPPPVELLPTSRVYWRSENDGYLEKRSVASEYTLSPDGNYEFEVTLPSNFSSLRFDPIEEGGVVCANITAVINTKKVILKPLNAVSYKDSHIFITSDPQFEIIDGGEKGDHLKVICEKMSFFTSGDFVPVRYGENSRIYGNAVAQAIEDMQRHYKKRFLG